MLRYAPEGQAWYSVDAPNVFTEYLLPTEENQRDRSQKAAMRRLERIAERHDAQVRVSQYRRG
jgi:hypothetical protein